MALEIDREVVKVTEDALKEAFEILQESSQVAKEEETTANAIALAQAMMLAAAAFSREAV